MPVEPRRLDQAHDRRSQFSASYRSGEEPVLAPKSPLNQGLRDYLGESR